jgi:hypothetical protein
VGNLNLYPEDSNSLFEAISPEVVSRSQTIIYSVSIEGGRDDNFIQPRRQCPVQKFTGGEDEIPAPTGYALDVCVVA